MDISTRYFAATALFAAIFVASCPALAAQLDEITVYDDGINKPGEMTLEMHFNGTPKGVTTPSFPGEYLTNGGVRVTPEFAYGLTKDLEFGAYFPEFAIDKNGNVIISGEKVRVKYLPLQPDEKTGGYIAGANVEFSRLDRHIAQSRTHAELRLISGYRSPEWLFAFNPIFDWSLSDGFASATPDFNYALKAARKIKDGLTLGAEYYSDIGPLDHVHSWNQQDNRIYAVADIELKPFNVNFGVGYGLTDASDRWTIKTIVEIPLK